MMEKPNLHLYKVVGHDTSRLTPQPKALRAWLDGLPMGDMESSALQVFKVLHEYNRCHLTSAVRLEALNIFGRVVQELTAVLASKYRDSSYPLSERNRERVRVVNKLLEEMAHGFKLLVRNHVEALNDNPQPGREFYDVVRISIVYLSRRIVSAYSTYTLEPEGVWYDLHQLYKLAEQVQGDDGFTEKTSKQRSSSVDDIVNAYLRIVMLSITNPYHLMQGEAQLIYNYLNKWVDGCRIVPVTGYLVDKGDLIIDLDHDVPPQFIFQDKLTQPKHCKSVDLSRLMGRFRETIETLTTRKESAGGIENSNLSFNERIRRDMLRRLQSVWDSRLERGAARKNIKDRVRLVSSLSASHYFIDGQNEFYPESDEVRIHKPERKAGDAQVGLALMPADYEPWKEEAERHRIDSELEAHRLSLFDADLDIWEKIFASKSHARALHELHSVQFRDHIWQQLNVSHMGMGLRYSANENARISVGDIVAYHPENDGSAWCLGVVSWMKEYASNHLDIGISLMPGQPRAVAVRAISGAGCGSEYFRALLTTSSQGGKNVCNVIVPASMYDLGTQLVINFRDELKYIRLTGIVQTSTCYSMFSFQDIAVPLVEQSKINEIKTA